MVFSVFADDIIGYGGLGWAGLGDRSLVTSCTPYKLLSLQAMKSDPLSDS